EAGSLQLVAHITQRGKVFGCEAYRIEEGNLLGCPAALDLACHHLPQLRHRMVGSELLDFAFDPRLRRKLNEYVGAQQYVPVQFGLAGAVAAHRIDVHAGTHHVVGEDRGILLVRSDGGDDVGDFNRLLPSAAYGDFHAQARKVASAFLGGGAINVVKAESVDAGER